MHYKREWRQTERGKMLVKASNKRYADSEKGKATKKRLNATYATSPIEIAMRRGADGRLS